jgi:hypothetical protein
VEAATEQRAQLLSRAQARLALLPQLDDSIRALTAVADSLPGMLLAARDPGTAQVDLMTRIRSTIDSSRVARLQGFEPADAAESLGPLTRASVVVIMESDFKGTIDALQSLEQNPALSIESLEVTAREPHSGQTSVEFLFVRVAVSAWFTSDTFPPGSDVDERVQG